MGLWRYAREFLMSLIGGLFGAVLGLVSTENMAWKSAIFLMIVYGFAVFILVFVGDKISIRRNQKSIP